MTDQFTFDAAPYVLGALSPEERQVFETHLAECPSCESQVREFAGLPGLLSRLPADEVAVALRGDPPPPPTMLQALQFTVRRERRARRWRVAASGLAAACLAIVATAFVVNQVTGDSPSGAPPVAAAPQAMALHPLGDAPVVASVSLVGKSWGTDIEMKCTYSGPGWEAGSEPEYTLIAYDRNNKLH
ncbi:MAG: hypothetical protein V7637_5294, partial [Mycobacteriales bacterium]